MQLHVLSVPMCNSTLLSLLFKLKLCDVMRCKYLYPLYIKSVMSFIQVFYQVCARNM